MIGKYITWKDIEEKFKGKYIITSPVLGSGKFVGGILDSVFDAYIDMENRVVELCKSNIKNYHQYIQTNEERGHMFIGGFPL